jgi:DNA-binding response OmpR family regulator
MPSTILVVDDEPDLAATYKRLLKRMGYRVIPTGTRRGTSG